MNQLGSEQPEPVLRRRRPKKEEFTRALLAATPRTWVTTGLVALNVALFAWMALRGVSLLEPSGDDLVRFGADYGPLTTGGQWWRLLTCAFVHIGILHLALNMWGLWQGGQLAERFYGNGAYLALYLASAVGGSFTSIAWSPAIVSAGASGAIFGVYGALLAVVVQHGRELPAAMFDDLKKSTVAVVGYNVFYGLVTPGIDNAAHIGGLATGVVVGFCLRCPMPALAPDAGGSTEPIAPVPVGPRARLVRLAPVAIGLVLAGVAAKHRVEAAPAVRAGRHFDLALEAWREGDSARAKEEVDAALALDPGEVRSLSLRGDLVWAGGNRDAAKKCYRKAIELAPQYPYPRMRLAWTEQDAGNLQAAEAEFTRAIELDRQYADAYIGRGWVRAQTGMTTRALDDYDRAIALDPTNGYARLDRARALHDLRRYEEALPVFQEHAAGDKDGALHSGLVAWTIRCRLGQREPATAELRARLAAHDTKDADALIGSFLVGDLRDDDLLNEIRHRQERSANGQWLELATPGSSSA